MAESNIARRRVIKGVAWSAPIIVTSSTIPAYAASTSPTEVVYPNISTGAADLGFAKGATNYYTGEVLCETDLCRTGNAITQIATTSNNTVIPAYGDAVLNVDSFGNQRVEVQEFSMSGQQVGSYPAGSERIVNISTYSSTTYVPTIDPSDKPAHLEKTASQSGALISNGASWKFINNGSNHEHVYGVAQTTDHLYWVGSRGQTFEIHRTNLDGSSSQLLSTISPAMTRMYSDGTNVYLDRDGGNKYSLNLSDGSMTLIPNTKLPTDSFIVANGQIYWLALSGYIFNMKASKWLPKPVSSTGDIRKITHTGASLSEFYALDSNGGVWMASLSKGFAWTSIGDISDMEQSQRDSITSIGGVGSSVVLGTNDGRLIFI